MCLSTAPRAAHLFSYTALTLRCLGLLQPRIPHRPPRHTLLSAIVSSPLLLIIILIVHSLGQQHCGGQVPGALAGPLPGQAGAGPERRLRPGWCVCVWRGRGGGGLTHSMIVTLYLRASICGKACMPCGSEPAFSLPGAGIVAAVLGAAVTATDLEHNLQLLQDNCTANGGGLGAGGHTQL